jgi:hypothetical protein
MDNSKAIESEEVEALTKVVSNASGESEDERESWGYSSEEEESVTTDIPLPKPVEAGESTVREDMRRMEGKLGDVLTSMRTLVDMYMKQSKRIDGLNSQLLKKSKASKVSNRPRMQKSPPKVRRSVTSSTIRLSKCLNCENVCVDGGNFCLSCGFDSETTELWTPYESDGVAICAKGHKGVCLKDHMFCRDCGSPLLYAGAGNRNGSEGAERAMQSIIDMKRRYARITQGKTAPDAKPGLYILLPGPLCVHALTGQTLSGKLTHRNVIHSYLGKEATNDFYMKWGEPKFTWRPKTPRADRR